MTSIAPGSVISPAVQRYLATFAPPSDATHDARRAAFERFCAVGFPGPYDEGWRQTPTAGFAHTAFQPAPGGAVTAEALAALHAGGPAPTAVFVNGHGDADAPPAGVAIAPATHPFVALNTALHTARVVLRITADTPEPVHLVFVNAPAGEPQEHHARVCVEVAPGTHAQLVESHVTLGAGAPTFSTHVTELTVGDGAQVEHTVWQQLGPTAHHVAVTAAVLGRDARLQCNGFTDGGALTRNEIQARFALPGAAAVFNGLLLGRGTDVVDYHTLVHHDTTDTQSRQLYKAILADRARGVFEGQVVIPRGAQRTGATQHNANLLLGDHAQIHTKPLLEIHADDVQCAHGAAIGQLDEAAAFYLRSRGIPAVTARRMLTEAFADEVVNAVANAAVRAWLAPRVRAALPQERSDA